MTRALVAALGFSLSLLLPLVAFAHTDGLLVLSDEAGGGALVVHGVPDEAIETDVVFCSGGDCLWASEEISVSTPDEIEPGEDVYPLAAGTTVHVEVVAVDAGVSLKLGSAKLDAIGESSTLGSAPDAHGHATWQIEAADDDIGERAIVLRFTASGGGYEPSEAIEILVTNGEHGPTTTLDMSTTSTTTTTLGGASCGNGVIEGLEACDAGPEPWSPGRACDDSCTRIGCGDPDGDGGVRATDALFILASAIGIEACEVCLCDVDAGASSGVTGTDALRALRVAVGLDAAALECTACID
jgi:hypothetical protein